MKSLYALAAFVLLAVASLPAEAHVETFSDAKTFNVGPYSAFIEPRPMPLFAGTSTSFSALVTDKRTGGYARDVELVLEVETPSGTNRSTPLKPDQTGYYVGSLLVTEPGNHTARLTVRDLKAAESHSAVQWFDVYPDLPYRVRVTNQAFDVYTGVPTELTFELVDASTYAPASSIRDASIRLEHWTDDHQTLLDTEDVPLVSAPGGRWVLEHTFRGTGMYHLRVASESGNFTYEQVPMLHLTATLPPESTETNGTPVPAWMALAAVALGAFLGARGRRT